MPELLGTIPWNGQEAAARGEAMPRPDSLRSYTNAKLALAAQLRVLREALKKRRSQSRFQQCEGLMAKLAQDRFTLAVVGQFKRGKSSLMNAIIEKSGGAQNDRQ